MTQRKLLATTIALIILFSPCAVSQDGKSQPDVTFSVDHYEYQLSVTTNRCPLVMKIRNSQGEVIGTDISAEMIEVWYGADPFPVKRVALRERPLKLALLVDVSRSQTTRLSEEVHAATVFLETFVQPGDTVCIGAFGPIVEPLFDCTNDIESLRRALYRLKASRAATIAATQGAILLDAHGVCNPLNILQGIPKYRPPSAADVRRTAERNPGTLLWKAISTFGIQMAAAPGPSSAAMIVLTDGINHGGRLSSSWAYQTLSRRGVTLYGIQYFDPAAYKSTGYRPDLTVFQKLSRSTGGRVYTERDGTLSEVFSSLTDELRRYHEVDLDADCRPDPARIRVAVNHPGATNVHLIGVGLDSLAQSTPVCELPQKSSIRSK